MSRGSSLLCAAVVGISAATFGCKSDEDAGAAFIRRYCELYQPCCVAAGLPGDGKVCRDLFVGAMSKQSKYNATAGESCLSTLMSVSSQPGFCEGDIVPPATCAQAFGGVVGACIQDADCPAPSAGDARCVSGFANGMQVRKCQTQTRGTAGGAPCVGTVRSGVILYSGTITGDVPDMGFLCYADDGLHCDGTMCVALMATGEACALSGPAGDCVDGNFCDVTTGTCAARKPIGAACIDQADECADGSYCDAGGMTCVAQLDIGAACTDNGQCVTETCSDAGMCAAPPVVGANPVCGG